MTLGQAAMQVWKQSGHMPQALAGLPSLPDHTEHVWEVFQMVDRCRGSTGFGPAPLDPLRVEGWLRLIHDTLDPWEVRALMELDDERLKWFGAQK